MVYPNVSQETVENKTIKNNKASSGRLWAKAQANIIKNIAPIGNNHNWLKNGITKRNKYRFDWKNVRIISVFIFIFFQEIL